MSLQVLDTDDEVTKELKETVIKIFVAAGVLETGFTKDSMAKYMLGMAQAGKLPGGPIVHLPEEEAIAFCHAQCARECPHRDEDASAHCYQNVWQDAVRCSDVLR